MKIYSIGYFIFSKSDANKLNYCRTKSEHQNRNDINRIFNFKIFYPLVQVRPPKPHATINEEVRTLFATSFHNRGNKSLDK